MLSGSTCCYRKLYPKVDTWIISRVPEHCAAVALSRYLSSDVNLRLHRQMTQDELKKAFRKASVKIHPDKTGDKSEAERARLEALSRGCGCFPGLKVQSRDPRISGLLNLELLRCVCVLPR